MSNLHYAIDDQLEEVSESVDVARQFLDDEGVEIGGDRYNADRDILFNDNGLEEFFKAWQCEHGMITTKDFPEGISDKDVNKAVRKDYPTMAAIGIIETARELEQRASTISQQGWATVEQCLNYATGLSRIKLLCSIMALKEARKKAVGDKQSERRKQAGANTRANVEDVANRVLADPERSTACRHEDGRVNIARLARQIVSEPDIGIGDSAVKNHLRDLIKEKRIE